MNLGRHLGFICLCACLISHFVLTKITREKSRRNYVCKTENVDLAISMQNNILRTWLLFSVIQCTYLFCFSKQNKVMLCKKRKLIKDK